MNLGSINHLMKSFIVFFIFAVIASICAYTLISSQKKTEININKNFSSAPQYFGSWQSYQIPFKPKDPISFEEAQQRRAYYIGYYNNKNQLSLFEKYLDGQLVWRDEYSYWENYKIKTRKMLKADGSEVFQEFDQHGRPLKE